MGHTWKSEHSFQKWFFPSALWFWGLKTGLGLGDKCLHLMMHLSHPALESLQSIQTNRREISWKIRKNLSAHFTKLEWILNYKFLDLGKYKTIKPVSRVYVKWAFNKLLFSKLSLCAMYYFKPFIYINMWALKNTTRKQFPSSWFCTWTIRFVQLLSNGARIWTQVVWLQDLIF